MPPSKIPSFAVKKVGLIAAGALIALGLSGLINFYSMQNLINVTHWVEHTDEVLRNIADMRLSLQRAEDAVAFYILTDEKARFQPLNDAIASTSQRLDELQNLTSDNPRQEMRLVQLKKAVNSEFTTMQTNIAIAGSKEPNSAQAALKNLESDPSRATINQLIEQITNEEQVLLRRRSLEAESSAQRTAASIAAAMFISILIVFLMIRLLLRQITRLEETEGVLKQTTAELTDLYNEAPFGYHLMDADGLFKKINNTELRWFDERQYECPLGVALSHYSKNECMLLAIR
jgi:CHASE3 domain sensor protein